MGVDDIMAERKWNDLYFPQGGLMKCSIAWLAMGQLIKKMSYLEMSSKFTYEEMAILAG